MFYRFYYNTLVSLAISQLDREYKNIDIIRHKKICDLAEFYKYRKIIPYIIEKKVVL